MPTRAALRLTGGTVGLYALTSVIAVLATSGLPLADRVIAATIATGVAVAVVLPLRRVAVGVLPVVAVAALAGVLRGAALVLVLAALDGAASPDPLRIANSTVSAVIWLGGIALVLSGREQYRAQYASAVRQVAEARAAASLDSLPEVMRLKTAAGSAASRSSTEPTAEALRDAAQALRDEIEERIRPLSHRIWFSARSFEPHSRIAPLVRDAARAFDVPVRPVVVVWTASSLIGAPVIYGMRQGIVSALACGAILAAMLLASRAVMRRRPSGALGPVLIALCATVPVAGTTALVRALGFAPAPETELPTFALVPLAIAALLLAASAATLANADRSRILLIADDRLRSGQPWPARDVSAYLHNSLQSELAGLAMQLDRAAPGTPEAQEAVERLAALASRSIADDFLAQRETPIARLRSGAAAWRGIAEVSVAVDPSVDEDDPRLPLAVQAVEELTSNAIRHGGARAVRVRIGSEGEGMAVTVASDGAASDLPPDGRGMGAAWLAAVAAEPVVVQPSADGAVVRVLL